MSDDCKITFPKPTANWGKIVWPPVFVRPRTPLLEWSLAVRAHKYAVLATRRAHERLEKAEARLYEASEAFKKDKE